MRRRKEVEDPDNTWNMQLMAAVINNDLVEADKMLLKGAKIDHFAAADISIFPATHVGNAAGGGGINSIGGRLHLLEKGALLQFHPSMLYTPLPTTSHFPVGLEIPHQTNTSVTRTVEGKEMTQKATNNMVNASTTNHPVHQTHHQTALQTQHLLQSEGVDGISSSIPLELDNAGNPLTPLNPNTVYISPFIAAILSENIEAATWVAAHGGNPNGQFNFNRNGTVLHFCVRIENALLLDTILNKRIIIDQTFQIDGVDNYTKLSPIQLALRLHKPEMARILIQHGCANPFSPLVDSRFTATQYACVVGDVQTLETYLNAGDNIRQWDSEGQTLFHLGLFHPPIIDFLLDFTSVHPGAYNNNTSHATSSFNTPIKSKALGAITDNHAIDETKSVDSDLKVNPYTLNDAYNMDGETPLIYVINHLSNFLPNAHPSWPVVVPVKGNESITHLDPNPKINNQTGTMIPPQGHRPIGGEPMVVWNASIGSGLAQLLLSHSSLSVVHADGAPPLGHGIVRPDVELVDFLMSRGADASYTCDQTVLGMSPLMHAIISYSPDIIKRLVTDLKVDINVRDKSGCTALHHAVNARNYGALELLCQKVSVTDEKGNEKGVSRTSGSVPQSPLGYTAIGTPGFIDFNAPDRRGETALHRAAIRNNVHAVQYLLQQPLVDVNAVDNYGKNALHAAVEANQIDTVRLLLKRCGPEVGVTPPLEKGKKAISQGKKGLSLEPQVPSRLIVDKEEISVHKRTPLQIAVAFGYFDIAEILITIGNADVNRLSINGTLLHDAAVAMNEKMVTLLIEKGAVVFARNQSDHSALHLICDKPYHHGPAVIDIARKLLTAGCVVDDQDVFNLYAPIHYACRNENVELLQVLLEEFNANPNISDKNLRTPLHYACRGMQEEFEADIAKRVLYVKDMEKMEKFSDSLVVMEKNALDARLKESFERRNRIIKLLITHGANLSFVDNEGKLPLHEMCNTSNYAGLVDMLRCIGAVSCAAQLWAVDCRGWTPMHAAVAIGGDTECVRELLVTYENTRLDTSYSDMVTGAVPVLDVVNKMFPTGKCKAASSLFTTEAGNSLLKILKKQDKEGRNPLFLSAAFGRTEIGRLLVLYQSHCIKGISPITNIPYIYI